MYTFHEHLPTPEKYNELREKAGWGPLAIDLVTRSLPNSQYAVCAKHINNTIAFARVVGDGGLSFYIQEIIVDPDHQKKGIASEFMKYILNYFKQNAGNRSYIGVFVGKDLEKFYEKYGFWKRPTSIMGSDMMQFWNDPEFNLYFNS